MLTVKELKKDEEVSALITVTDEQLGALGFTEHSERHVSIVSNWAGDILRNIGATEREINLVEIAGYLHDIGNCVNRHEHALTGAVMAYDLLRARNVPYIDCAEIMMAIGNHDEQKGTPVSVISSALIIADKADVHRSRVRSNKRYQDKIQDIHDRVNYAVEKSFLDFSVPNEIILNLTIDTSICSVMDYFEIYFNRMQLCRKAAEFLDRKFGIVINDTRLL